MVNPTPANKAAPRDKIHAKIKQIETETAARRGGETSRAVRAMQEERADRWQRLSAADYRAVAGTSVRRDLRRSRGRIFAPAIPTRRVKAGVRTCGRRSCAAGR
ncbi:hypothetical protein CDO26_34530 (plasmid) [Sinorhizobium meliloti]|nr:hypothetical protein CDO26_34530 [Sinorhizobium meliloti]